MIVRLDQSDDFDTVRIIPSALRRWLWPLLLPQLAACLLFGAFAIWQRGRWEVPDLLCLACFSVGAVLLAGQTRVVVRQAARMPRVTLQISPAGLTLYETPGPGTLPWPAIEAIGLVRDDWMGQTAGLRLRSYDELQANLARSEVHDSLAELRRSRGYEVQIPRRLLDGSVEEFLCLLDEYLERYGPPRPPE